MKTANLARWIVTLRSKAYRQTTGYLGVRITDNDWRFCADGVGCEVSGMQRATLPHGSVVAAYYRDDNHESDMLPPPGFHVWLGLPEPSNPTAVHLDWPENLPLQDCCTADEQGDPDEDCAPHTFRRCVTVEYLNDTCRLTFDQIADCLQWAGVTSDPDTQERLDKIALDAAEAIIKQAPTTAPEPELVTNR